MNERPQHKNNECLDMGLLVSLRDDELLAGETMQTSAHLALCPDCAADARAVIVAGQEVYDLLAGLGEQASEMPDTATAFASLQATLDRESDHVNHLAILPAPALVESRPRHAQRNRRRRYGWIAAVAAAALIALVLVPNASALATQFFALFHAQQFQPVTVDPQNFSEDLISYLNDFGDMQVQYTDLAHSLKNPTEAQVKQLLNFPLMLPGHLPQGVGHAISFTLLGSADATYTFNVTKVRAYLAQSGQSNIAIPAQLDGATFTISSDTGVVIHYASSCRLQSVTATSLFCTGGTPFYAAEIPSPVVQATGKASLKDLRDFLLSLPKLAPDMRAILQQLDLANGTVPLPIPRAVAAQQVTVRGAPGVVLVDSSLKVGGLVWQAGGIIYMIATVSTSSADLQAIASSFA
ncbi:MAG TPA: hypothetical protein VIZ18_03625 [Ktedonobacteraceae bacterium]